MSHPTPSQETFYPEDGFVPAQESLVDRLIRELKELSDMRLDWRSALREVW